MRALPLLAALTLLLPRSDAQDSPSPDWGAAVDSAMEVLHRAGSECDWPAVVQRAQSVRSLVPRGSDAWLEAGAWEIVAHYETWQPDGLERVGRDLLAALAERRAAEPKARRSSLGPVHPIVAGHLAEAIVIFARLLQSRGHHEDALGHLRLLLDDLSTGPTLDAASRARSAQLEASRSLIALGRVSDACTAMRSLCEVYPATREATTASALLQSDYDGPAAYKGKYRDETAVRGKLLAVKNLLPTARARLAQRLGWREAEIPRVPLGFADLPSDMRGMSALTEGDPRRPRIPPVVIVFTEPIALELGDRSVDLVHELSHATLMVACGPAYHRLPLWMMEGISETLAEQHEVNVRMLLVSRLADDPAGFCGDAFWTKYPLVLASPPCAASATPGAGLAMELLADEHGIEGLRRLIEGIRSGRPWEEALREVTGKGEEAYLLAAHDHAQAKLEARRVEALPQARELVGLEGKPQDLLAAAERIAAKPSGSIALGFALWSKARALAALGRHGEALAAFRDLHGSRREQPSYVEMARAGEAGALLALGRTAEARERLLALRRDAMQPTIHGWAEAQLSKLK